MTGVTLLLDGEAVPVTSLLAEEIGRLRAAAETFLKRHDELVGDLESFFTSAAARDIKWTAGNWKDELDALREALALSTVPPEPSGAGE